MSKLSSLFIKSAKETKSKKAKADKGGEKRKRGAGKKSGKNATTDTLLPGPAGKRRCILCSPTISPDCAR